MSDYSEKSFWLSTYGPYLPEPPLAGDHQFDVAIIGGGFTGLATAFNLRRDAPGLTVAVLEAAIVGFGASGRNGGFSMTLFGLEPAVTKTLFGRERLLEAHRYMEKAVDYVDALVKEHHLQSDYNFAGFLRAATTPGYARRIQHDLDLLLSLGITGIEWIDATAIRSQVDSPHFLGGWWEPRCGLLNPAKHVRELKRIAQEAGACIFEETPVVEIERNGKFVLRTPNGSVTAEKVVFATNAYSHLFPQLRSRQVPAFTHMVVTEPLSRSQLASIGWQNRQGVEDARNLVHYFRLSADDRLIMGGSDVSISYGKDMERDLNARVFTDLEHDVTWLFPGLKGVHFTHRWGGPVSVPVDLAPAIGFIRDARAIYSLGCVGHGVSTTHLNGRTIADLVLERQTELTEVWFVKRRMIPWPPEPLRLIASHAIRGYMRLEDAIFERKVVSN
jgi:glycine/D-amino acid oxidase-like deaminating enzyme